jgi:uroporphyrinogen-III decarboxylase
MKPADRGAVEETFFPWLLTVERFKREGLDAGICDAVLRPEVNVNPLERYFQVAWGEGFYQYERILGFDPVRRTGFILPLKPERASDEKKPPVSCQEDWKKLKEFASCKLDEVFTDRNILQAYSPLRADQERGDYAVRMHIEGFFWVPRNLFGIEPHLYAFYDFPELMHDINQFILDIFLTKLVKVLEALPADLVYIMEDLSGTNGPMLSPALFDEFVGSYYRRLIPVLKRAGAKHVFIDTDGDFRRLIPNFLSAGVDGFMPMDVNAGMDIVQVRRDFPRLKFIGGYNKLCIAGGRESIDQEFNRLLPIIRKGGYIPGCDHQVAPSTSLKNYRYYIQKLSGIMEQAGADL